MPAAASPTPVAVALPPSAPAAHAPSVHDYGAAASNVLAGIGAHLSAFTSTGKLEGFSLSDMFSETFRHRSPDEIESTLLVGTARTTPDILEVKTGWPKPWFFMRVFLFVAAVYVLFLASLVYFANPKFIPGFIFMGSLAVPLAVLVLFFELNTPRNVSFYSLLALVAMGGVLSLIVASIGYQTSFLDSLGAPQAGHCGRSRQARGRGDCLPPDQAQIHPERHAVRRRHWCGLRRFRDGRLRAAGVPGRHGSGWLQYPEFFRRRRLKLLNSELFTRAWLSPFGHVVWTAITAGALWRAKKDLPFNFRMLDGTFWKKPPDSHGLPHGLDFDLAMGADHPNLLNYAVTLALGAISWYVAFGLVQQGLKQVAEEQVLVLKKTHPQTATALGIALT